MIQAFNESLGGWKVTCGSEGLANYRWCHGDAGSEQVCEYDSKGRKISINIFDKRLCSAKEVWKNLTCDVPTEQGGILGAPRCNGTIQHCLRPWYAVPSGVPTPGFKQKCLDKSDQIFDIGTQCNASYYLKIHNDRFCNLKTWLKNQDICVKPNEWLARQTKEEYADPHNCQASCLEPGPGCEACTNPEYVSCPKSGKCVHPDLWCDGHPQCPDGEDENLDKCFNKYIANKVIHQYATLECLSKVYPNMKIMATVCDNDAACLDDEDEKGCSSSTSGKLFWGLLIATSFFCICLYTLQNIFCGYQEGSNETMNMIQMNDQVIIRECENNPGSQVNKDNLSLMLLQMKYTKKSEEVNKTGLEVYEMVSRISKGNEASIFQWLHMNFDLEICALTLQSKFPSLETRIIRKFEKTFGTRCITRFLDHIKLNEKTRRVLFHLKTITFMVMNYVDIFKDTYVAIIIQVNLGGPEAVLSSRNFHKFTSVVVMCLFATIIVPLMISSLHLALECPHMIFNYFKEKPKGLRKRLMQAGNIFLSLANAILLKHTFIYNKEEARRFAKEAKIGTIQMLKRCKTIKLQYVECLKHELALEAYYQVSAQILLLLLAKTLTATTGGLQTFLVNSSDKRLGIKFTAEAALTLSILWSLRTCVTLHLKAILVEKVYFPGKSKLYVLVWASLVTATRVFSMVIFFVPSMGLCNLLYHWQAEQIPFSVRQYVAATNGSVSPDAEIQLRGMTEAVLWSQLDRWDYTDPAQPRPPHYSLYTGLSLAWTFFAFFAITALQLIALYIVKYVTSEDFKHASVFNKLVHCLENINITMPFRDWDSVSPNWKNQRSVIKQPSHDEHFHAIQSKSAIMEYKERFQNVEKEMIFSTLVNIVVSFLMLIPLCYTGTCSCDTLQLRGPNLPVQTLQHTRSGPGTSCSTAWSPPRRRSANPTTGPTPS